MDFPEGFYVTHSISIKELLTTYVEDVTREIGLQSNRSKAIVFCNTVTEQKNNEIHLLLVNVSLVKSYP